MVHTITKRVLICNIASYLYFQLFRLRSKYSCHNYIALHNLFRIGHFVELLFSPCGPGPPVACPCCYFDSPHLAVCQCTHSTPSPWLTVPKKTMICIYRWIDGQTIYGKTPLLWRNLKFWNACINCSNDTDIRYSYTIFPCIMMNWIPWNFLYLEYVHSLIRRKKTKNKLKYVQYSD